MKKLAMITLAAATMALTSCFQQEQTLSVNPDGSGKFTTKMTINMGALGGLMQLGNQGGSPGAGEMPDVGKQMIQEAISKSKGVDVWSDASHETDAEGKTTITLSGYFKDVSKLKVNVGSGGLGGGLGGEGGGDSGMPEISAFRSSKDADGNWILEVPMDDLAKAGKKEDGETAPEMTDEEIKQSIDQAKMGFSMMKGMMGQFMKDMKSESKVIVGGTITDSGCFKKDGDNTASLSMDFTKMLDAMEAMINDPELMKKASQKGGDPMKNLPQEKILEAVLGKGKPRIVITPGKPLFDYAAESAKAKEGQSDSLKALIKEAGEKEKTGGEPDKVDEVN